MSTIGDLRKLLSTIDESHDNDPLTISVEYGYGCGMTVTDVDVGMTEIQDPNDEDVVFECLMFSGIEDTTYSQ